MIRISVGGLTCVFERESPEREADALLGKARTGASALKMLDSARTTLDRLDDALPTLHALSKPGTPDGAAAVLAGIAAALGREADALLVAGHDEEGERVVFLLANVLDTLDFVGGIGTT